MKRVIRRTGDIVMIAAGLMLSTSSLAMAQGTTQSSEAREIIFGEVDEVTGVLINPDGEHVDARTPSKTVSLIKVRQDFVPELLESTKDVGP